MIIGTSNKRRHVLVYRAKPIEEKPTAIVAQPKKSKKKGIGCPKCNNE